MIRRLSSHLPLFMLAVSGCDTSIVCAPDAISEGGRCLGADVAPDDAGADTLDPSDANVDAGDTSGDASDAAIDAGTPSLAFVVAPERVRATLPRDEVLLLEIARTDFEGPVRLSVEGLVPGTATDSVVVDAEETEEAIVLRSAATATGGPYALMLVAEAVDLPGVRAERALELIVADAPGTLDSSFGVAGLTSIPGENLTFGGATLDADGRLVLCAWEDDEDGAATHGFVARIESNGRLDAEFGDAGIIADVGPQLAMDVAVTDGGVRVLAGQQSGEEGVRMFVRALDDDGAADPEFGLSGDAILPENALFWELVSNANRLAAVSISGPDQVLVLDDAGNLRRTETEGVGGADQIPASLAIQDDGTLTVGALVFDPEDTYLVRRVDEFGALLEGFGSSGTASTTVTGLSRSYTLTTVANRDEGRLFVGGEATVSGTSRVEVYALEADGSFDDTFGTATYAADGYLLDLLSIPGGVVVLGGFGDTDGAPLMRAYDDAGRPMDAFDAAAGIDRGEVWDSTRGELVLDEAAGRIIACGVDASRTSVRCQRHWL